MVLIICNIVSKEVFELVSFPSVNITWAILKWLDIPAYIRAWDSPINLKHPWKSASLNAVSPLGLIFLSNLGSYDSDAI